MKDKSIESYKSNTESSFLFLPRDISLDDDGFHGSEASRFTEWWYFDGVFDNGYSIQMSVRVLSIIKKRLVLVFQRLDIYKDGNLLQHNKKRYSFKNFKPSPDSPKVTLADMEVIKGGVDKTNGNLVYDLSFRTKNTSAHLRFEGCTAGWKGKNPGGDWWAVFLPRARVKGTITIDGKEINVQGLGYHDHNWDVRGSAAKINHGWFWGKINFNNYTITWATIFKNRFLGQPLLVINENNKGYLNIKPENIRFIGDDLRLENGNDIPHQFLLEAHTDHVTLQVKMKVVKIHHVKIMFKHHYWRYHVSCKGSIRVNSIKESIDETHIAEFIMFK
jgi:predicted secreted hydrolase